MAAGIDASMITSLGTWRFEMRPESTMASGGGPSS